MSVVEYTSPFGTLKTCDYIYSDTYYSIAERLGAPINSKPVVCIRNGKPVLRKDWDKCVGLIEDEIKFVQIPQSGLRNILQLIATIALTAVAGPIAGLIAVPGTLAYSFVQAAIVVGGTFLISALFRVKPATNKGPSPTYSLNSQGNQARLMQPIPKLYGRHKIFPDFASQPFQSYEDNDQYLYELFCLGVGHYDTEKIFIGETELWDSVTGTSDSFREVTLEFIPPGSQITLFPSNVITSVEVGGMELRNETFDATGDFLVNRITFDGTVSKIEHLNVGDKIVISGAGVNNGTFVITDKDDVDFLWIEFGTTFTTVNDLSKTYTLDNWAGPFVANPSNQGTDQIKVDFSFPRGLYKANEEGGLDNFTVTYEVEVRQIDNFGAPIGSWQPAISETVTRRTQTPQRMTKTIEVTRGRYEVRARRTTQNEHDSTFSDELVWEALRAFIPDDNIYPDVTLLALKIRASNQLTSASSTQISTIIKSKIPTYNGTSWTAPVFTVNPAWVGADVLRNSVYGMGLNDNRIDIDKLYELSQIYTARNDEFNGIFDTSRTLWDTLNTVFQVVRTQPILAGGKISFFRDQPRAIAKTVVTPQSIVRDTFNMEHILKGEETADDVIVEFMDSTTWEQSEVQCTLPGSSSTSPARIQLFGITNRNQAWREGMYYAASNSYRRIMTSMSIAAEGRLLMKGDPVIVSHDLPEWNQAGYVQTYNSTTRKLSLDVPVIFADTGIHYIILRRRDGQEFGPVRVSAGTYDNEVIFNNTSLTSVESAQGIDIEDVLVYDDSAKTTTFNFGVGIDFAKRFIVSSTSAKNFDAVDIALVIDDPRVYEADTGTPPPPPDYLGPGVVPNGPSINNLYIVQAIDSEPDPVKLEASWAVAVGATSYTFQISDNGTVWNNIYQGPDTSVVFETTAGNLYSRVLAIGTVAGPWKSPNTNPMFFGTVANSPNRVRNISVDNGLSVNVTFNAGARATSYRVQLYTESVEDSGTFDTLRLTKTVSSPTANWTNAQLIAVGGPFDRIMISVISINSYGESSAVTKIEI